jgi:hypothetical protein
MSQARVMTLCKSRTIQTHNIRISQHGRNSSKEHSTAENTAGSDNSPMYPPAALVYQSKTERVHYKPNHRRSDEPKSAAICTRIPLEDIQYAKPHFQSLPSLALPSNPYRNNARTKGTKDHSFQMFQNMQGSPAEAPVEADEDSDPLEPVQSKLQYFEAFSMHNSGNIPELYLRSSLVIQPRERQPIRARLKALLNVDIDS